MKDFVAEVRIKNNRLRARRLELGMSQANLAEAAGVGYFTYNGLECLRISPLRKNGDWRESASKLAEFHGVSEEELFTQSIMLIKQTSTERFFDAEDISRLDDREPLSALPSPHDAMEQKEISLAIKDALSRLDDRHRTVTEARFGLGRFSEPLSLRDAGRVIGVSTERARQMVAKVLCDLRKKSIANDRLREVVGVYNDPD